MSQLVLNGDDREDDDDGEPSLAVPEVTHRQSQERVWRSSCRSWVRDEDLEPNFAVPEIPERLSQETAWMHAACSADPRREELEDDIDTHEMDELDEREADQLDKGEADTEEDGDEFPYDPPRTLAPFEPAGRVRERVEAELRKRGLRDHAAQNIELVRWRR